jgi:hypothetical protein
MCTVDYHYNGATFTTLIALGRSTTVFVDPRDTSKRMTEVDFDGRLEETTVDLVLASVLLVGATTTTTIHLLHIRRRRAST